MVDFDRMRGGAEGEGEGGRGGGEIVCSEGGSV